ncbi:CoA transferase (plasmid) [Sulfitobacter sp. LCG007]
MKPASDGPLAGIRILALEQYGAGPFASMYLSDMGAEVIKIEPPAAEGRPGGDSSRQSGPHYLGPDDSQFFQTFNLGKKSVVLDIRSPDGRSAFERLVATADVVLNNMRGDQPGRLGLDYSSLSAINPRVVCSHLSGYGRSGERATWPAYDYLLQAEAGYMHLTGEPDGPPARMGLSMVDYMTGLTLAFATAAALVGALKTGRGRDVDVTLYDVAMHQLSYPATWYLNEGVETVRQSRSAHPSVVPCETYPTADGHIFLMCVLPKFWRALCTGIGLPELVDDPLFATPAARRENRAALSVILDERLSTRPTAEWIGMLGGTVPVAPVLTLKQALDNPLFAAGEGLQTLAGHPARDSLRVLSNPVRLDGERVAARLAPSLGSDTRAVLREVGLDDAAIDGLIAAGAAAGGGHA